MSLVKVDFKKLVNRIADGKRVLSKKATKQDRIDSWKEQVDLIPIEKLVDLDDRMSGFVDYKFAKVVPTEPRALSHNEIVLLGMELLDSEHIKEVMVSTRERVRQAFFNHLNATLDEDDFSTATVLIPDIGMKFERRAAGYADATYDKKKLREILGEYADEVISVEREIVETEKVDEDRLVELILANPELEEKMKSIITPGKKRDGSFYFEPIK